MGTMGIRTEEWRNKETERGKTEEKTAGMGEKARSIVETKQDKAKTKNADAVLPSVPNANDVTCLATKSSLYCILTAHI
jgi:spore germination cell wall hydrolase CwlJ-like protein